MRFLLIGLFCILTLAGCASPNSSGSSSGNGQTQYYPGPRFGAHGSNAAGSHDSHGR
jgi:hypothetical protein